MAEKVVVYGSGCKRCQQLRSNAQEAADQRGLGIEVGYSTDMGEIAAKGILSLPALEVDGIVTISGRVPDVAEIAELL